LRRYRAPLGTADIRRQAGIAGDRQAPASGAVDPGDGFDYLDDGGNIGLCATHSREFLAHVEELAPLIEASADESERSRRLAMLVVEVLFRGVLLETSVTFARRSLSTTVRRDLALEAPRSSP